jgi:hypothetical protein
VEQTSKHASREEDLKQSEEPSKPVLFKDECTAFLSNLAFEVHGIIPSELILIISRHGTAINLFLKNLLRDICGGSIGAHGICFELGSACNHLCMM